MKKLAKPSKPPQRFIVLVSTTSTYQIVDTERREVVCEVGKPYHLPDADGTARDRASRICSLFNQVDFW